jgi:hypothetical protein
VKNILISIGIAFFSVLLGSCGKETQNTTQGGGVFKVRVTIDPPLQSGTAPNGGSNAILFNITGVATYTWYGNQRTNALSTIETDELSVTTGQNISIWLQSFSNTYDFMCRTVKIEALQNGKVNETHIFSLGFNNDYTKLCGDGASVSKNFIIK